MSGQVLDAVQRSELDVGYTISPGQAARQPEAARGKRERPHVEALTQFTYRVVAPPGWGTQVRGRGWAELVRSGVGLSLARDSQAIHESQAHGLVVADRVALDAVLGFVCLQRRRESAVVQCAFDALARAWQGAGLG